MIKLKKIIFFVPSCNNGRGVFAQENDNLIYGILPSILKTMKKIEMVPLDFDFDFLVIPNDKCPNDFSELVQKIESFAYEWLPVFVLGRIAQIEEQIKFFKFVENKIIEGCTVGKRICYGSVTVTTSAQEKDSIAFIKTWYPFLNEKIVKPFPVTNSGDKNEVSILVKRLIEIHNTNFVPNN